MGGPQGTGWVSVNDGSAFASQLSRWLDICSNDTQRVTAEIESYE
jgi:hypothetical protein